MICYATIALAPKDQCFNAPWRHWEEIGIVPHGRNHSAGHRGMDSILGLRVLSFLANKSLCFELQCLKEDRN